MRDHKREAERQEPGGTIDLVAVEQGIWRSHYSTSIKEACEAGTLSSPGIETTLGRAACASPADSALRSGVLCLLWLLIGLRPRANNAAP